MTDFNYFNKIQPGKVRTFICSDVSEELSSIDLSYIDQNNDFKIVTLTWQGLPGINSIINDILKSLAKISLEIWPSWYNDKVSFNDSKSFDDAISNNFSINSLFKIKEKVSKFWLKKAIFCCKSKKLPLPKGFPNEVQASQLSLTIDSENLLFIIGIKRALTDKKNLFGFAKAAEWFARETNCRVAALIPNEYSNCKELDSILYNAFSLIKNDELQPKNGRDEEKYLIWPFYGKPHPASPGEQKLAKYLLKDEELSGLFGFNQKVKTIRNNNYIVDLLWVKGKLVVEVDGYKYHSNKSVFNSDRNRDYELIISGYTVLRIPHSEITEDVLLAMEKIRDVVRFCKKK
ncbi:DUF559 domain-containing protein [Candidatus Magnetomoraceae bacterium gMMP-15]